MLEVHLKSNFFMVQLFFSTGMDSTCLPDDNKTTPDPKFQHAGPDEHTFPCEKCSTVLEKVMISCTSC